MTAILARLLHDERGAIQIEYALIAALIGVVTALSLGALGDAMDGTYQPILHAEGSAQTNALPDAVAR